MGFFDLFAPVYDQVFRVENVDIFQNEFIPADAIIVDLGGGTGRISSKIINKKRKIFVFDLSFNMLCEVGKKAGLSAAVVSGEKIAVPKASTSVFIVVDAFHHFQSRKSVVKEIHRSLKDKGLLIIQEPDIDNFFIKIIAFIERLLGMNSKFYRFEEIKDFVIPLGFSVKEFQREKSNYTICFKKNN